MNKTLEEIFQRMLVVRVIEDKTFSVLSEGTKITAFDSKRVEFDFNNVSYKIVSITKVPKKIATITVKV